MVYQRRFYRGWVNSEDLYLTKFLEKETDLQILTDKPIDKNFLKEKIRMYRFDIENYINRDHRFLTALKPIEIELNAAKIVKEMATQAKKAHVGPLACVAGAIAEFLGRDLLRQGHKDVIIENGGDIFLKTTKVRAVRIYAGKSKLWDKITLKIRPKNTPLGICTSSGAIGHSLSFGCADSVVIISKNASLADAVATATANKVNSRADLAGALNFARAIRGVHGVVIILGNNLTTWGEIEFLD